jgi:two-component system, OmpR family, sensor histidine kinase KdpD
VRETLPDGILSLADEVILIDVSPETLRQRLREGKVYPPERIETALTHFFRSENLFALRELALREAFRARHRERVSSPFERVLLSVGSRPIDIKMIPRTGRIAARLAIEFAIAHVTTPNEKVDKGLLEAMRAEARKTNTEWIEETAADVPGRLIEIARTKPETTIAVAGTLRMPRWLQPPSFARRLLDAGARELLVLMPPKTTAEVEAPPE